MVSKLMYLLFNMLFRLVITFLPKNKCLLTSWLQSPSAVILERKRMNSATVAPPVCHEAIGPDAMILVSWMLCFKPTLSVSTFTFIVIIINWKLLKEMGIPDHLTCLLRNLYAGQEPTVRTWTWNSRVVPNRKRSMSRLYIVTLLI